jgi:hypothetical protein
MSCRRRGHALIGAFVTAFFLWPPSPAVDTAHARGRITKKFNRAATASPATGQVGRGGAARRAANLRPGKANPLRTQRMPGSGTGGWRVRTWAVPPKPAKRTTGTTVLGPYHRYIFKANNQAPHRYHNVPSKHVPGRITYRKGPVNIPQWRANRKFLDRTILRGDRIILADSAHRAEAQSGFQRELLYLRSKGYTVSRDGRSLLPPVGGARITRAGRISGRFTDAAAVRSLPEGLVRRNAYIPPGIGTRK